MSIYKLEPRLRMKLERKTMINFPLILIGLVLGWTDIPPVFAAQTDVKEGWYSITCGAIYFGKTKAAASQSCIKKDKTRGSLTKICGCAHADLIEIKKDQKPAFYLTSKGHFGLSPEAAIKACESDKDKWLAGLRKEERQQGSDNYVCKSDEIRFVYGPYARRSTRRQYDNAKDFPYFGFDGDGLGEWCSSDGQETCLTGDTQVLTPNGNRAINTIEVGDKVLTWSQEKSSLVEARVFRVKRRQVQAIYSVRFDDTRTLQATGNHPIYVPSQKSWVPVEELKAGDVVSSIKKASLSEMRVTSISREEEDTDVFDLSIESERSFFAEGIWVHNY